MKTIIILILAIYSFFSCKENKLTSAYPSTNNNQIIDEEDDKINSFKKGQYEGIFYGKKFETIYPLRIGEFGDRFYTTNTPYKRLSLTIEAAEKIKSKLNINLDLSEDYQMDPGYSYGYSVLGENLITEIVGFGWNDNSISDDVKYFTYLISHDSLGRIFDSKILAYANNMDSLSFQEVNFLNEKEFILIRYNFIEYQDYIEKKSPTKVSLIRNVFKIDETGKIKHQIQLETKQFDCNSPYNDFGGIFKNNQQVLGSNYWLK